MEGVGEGEDGGDCGAVGVQFLGSVDVERWDGFVGWGELGVEWCLGLHFDGCIECCLEVGDRSRGSGESITAGQSSYIEMHG